MENMLGGMSPQMLRVMFSSPEAQAQGFTMIGGMLAQNGVTEVVCMADVWTEENPVYDSFTVNEFTEKVLRTLLEQFDIPYLLEGDNGAD